MKIKICDAAPESACSYYRSIGPLSKLSKLDPSISVEYMKVTSWTALIDADIILFARPQTQVYLDLMKRAKNFNIPVWVDIDDNLFVIPKDNPNHKFFSGKEVFDMMKECIKAADVVTVATDALKKSFKHLNDNIVVIENSFNDYNFPFKKINEKSNTIYWRGSDTHRADLLSCSDRIFEIAKKYEEIWAWVFIGGRADNSMWYITDYIKRVFSLPETDIVSYHSYIRKLTPSVQIIPLVVNEFNLSKSNCSWLEATFSGAAAIAPLGLPEFNKPGIINYNHENKESFGYYLEKLLKDRKFRDRNYDESFEYISENLLLSTINKKRIEVIKSLMDKNF